MAKATASTGGVTDRHKDYDRFAKKWKRARAVIGGQDAIYEGAEEFLPKLGGEVVADYKVRLIRTPFFNASWRTVSGFVGMLFKKDPVVEVPKGLEPYMKDVTLSGVSFIALAKDILLEDFIVSRVGVLVDHPPAISGLTKAQAEARGQRPTMTGYTAETIINHRYEYRGNKKTLVQVRLAEELSEADGEFGETITPIIRVLDLNENGQYRQRVYDAGTGQQKDADIYPVMNGKFLEEIPFYFIGIDGTDGNYEDPEMIDLFDLNIKHFQASADYVHACHLTALPTPWITGYQEAPDMATGAVTPTVFRIGSTVAWVFPDPETKIGFLEFEGKGVDSLKELVEGYERQMAAAGARMLAPEKTGVEAEGTLAMRHSGENSILASAAGSVSDGLTKALNMFAKWCGYPGECKFEINKNYMPFTVTPQQITAWLAAVQAGRMSAETFFWNMQRADQVPEDRTFEEEQAQIDADPVPRPVPTGNVGPKDEFSAEREDARLEQERKDAKGVDKAKPGA